MSVDQVASAALVVSETEALVVSVVPVVPALVELELVVVLAHHP